ncbi:MAG: efflux RND transporter permease subunit [Spirochaetia bacterium]|nr:efflux RND transporter permease subunit [Spirochaetia bacterium]
MLSKIAIENPVFSWMVMIAFIIFGILSFREMGISRLPDTDAPVLNIDLRWEGASASVMETDIVDIVENAISGIDGVKEMRSVARDGEADITLELDLDKNVDVALQEVQAKIERAKRLLPPELEPAIITKSNPDNSPIVWVTLTSSRSIQEQMMYVRNVLLNRYQSIPGVGEISFGGYVERNIRIWLDADQLNRYELTAEDVLATIEQQHSEVPAGLIENDKSEFSVRSMGESSRVKELENLFIITRGGRPVSSFIRLGDIARIEDGLADIKRISRFDSKPSVGLGIRKQSGSNAVSVGKLVKEKTEELKKTLPDGYRLDIATDYTVFVEESIHELIFTIFLSAFLTGAITWLFFGNPSSTVNVMLAVPTSIIGTFIILNYFNFTLNTFTLLGLTLATGILVDDAIMVLENIVRHRENGESLYDAALNGAKEITFAALASTLAIAAIFLPVAFMEGPTGRYFLEFGVTISVAVFISLLEALTLTTMRSSRFLQIAKDRAAPFFMDRYFSKIETMYMDLLNKTLHHPGKILLTAGVLFGASFLLLIPVKQEFVPPQDQSRLFIRISLPIGYSIHRTDEIAKECEKIIKSHSEVLHYFTAVGGYGGGQSNRAMMFVTLKPPEEREMDQRQFASVLRKKLNAVSPDIRAAVLDPSTRGFSARRGYPVEISISGKDWNVLAEKSETILGIMKKNPLLVDADSDYEPGQPEIRILPNRERAAERGVSMDNIGRTVNTLIGGRVAGKFQDGGHNYDIRVRLEQSQVKNESSIRRILLRNNYGEIVKISDIVSVRKGTAMQSITRVNGQRSITLNANPCADCTSDESMKEALKIANNHLPEGYTVHATGISRESEESRDNLIFALVFGIVLSYMILASQFNSLIHPFTVLLSMPFSFTGAILALFLTGTSLSVYSFIGLILLMGLVKKNSILLVDFANQAKKKGLSPEQALLHACPIRLRPILMTALSSIAAAVPPALALGPGAESHKGMALVVIGGMMLSTLLTLFVVPAAYQLLDRFEKEN